MVRFSKAHLKPDADLSQVAQIRKRASEFYPFLRNAYFRSKVRELEPICSDKTGRRYWELLSNRDLYIRAMAFIVENNLTNKIAIHDLDSGLDAILRKRNLLDYCFLDDANEKGTKWRELQTSEFLHFVQQLIENEGIRRSGELRKKYPALGMAISRKGLSSQINYPERGRFLPIRGVNCPIWKKEKPSEPFEDDSDCL